MRRDLTGLLVIFLMPVVLVIVVTLVQQNVLTTMGGTKMKGLFANQDQQAVGAKIVRALGDSGTVVIADTLHGAPVDVETVRKAVAQGEYQFGVVIPEGTTRAFQARAKQAAENSITVNEPHTTTLSGKPSEIVPDLLVYFDPALSENARTGITGILKGTLLVVETDEKMKAFAALLPKKVEAAARKSMGSQWSDDFKDSLPNVRIAWDGSTLMRVTEKTARYGKIGKPPTTVQQNVPAWTLFGMFFIVVPLGGSLLRERQADMLVRLLTMPISCLTILAAKIIAYLMICIIQFLLILLIGTFLLPTLGTPALEMGSSPGAILMIVLAASLAACGYGILLGTMARTYDQAASFGAVSIVIGAALGGIMVPVYVMPGVMQKISVLSPLSWGLNAFLDVFVRGGGVRSIMPNVSLLLGFFLVTTLASWFLLAQRGRIRMR
jgi:ABC-2 type transport system permease protein